MALQIRRGTSAERTSITPAEGELLYTTDTKLVYVGDGATAGGNVISGGGGGITDIVNDTSPQLGGNLDVNDFAIFNSTTNANISITATGTGEVRLNETFRIDSDGDIFKPGDLYIAATQGVLIGDINQNIDGNLAIIRNTYLNQFGVGITFSQHHETADAVDMRFIRSRGDFFNPLTVRDGDELMEITYQGHDGINRISCGQITAIVDGDVSTGRVPTKLAFYVHNGINSGSSGVRLRAEIKPDGTFNIDKLSGLNGTSITMPTTDSIDIGDVRLSSDGLSTFNSNANLFITANAGGRVYLDGSAWPASLGTSGQFLSTDGAGSLSWSNPPGSAVRTTASGSTTSIADGITTSVEIVGYKTYSLLKIESSHAAWIRVYVSDAARTADAARSEGTDPLPGAGVLAEIVTTGAETILMSPGVFGWNNESPVTTNIPCAVTNKSGSTAIITVTLTLVQLEV